MRMTKHNCRHRFANMELFHLLIQYETALGELTKGFNNPKVVRIVQYRNCELTVNSFYYLILFSNERIYSRCCDDILGSLCGANVSALSLKLLRHISLMIYKNIEKLL